MTKPKAYYNEIDPHAAAWLRNLIAEGHIAEGDVDERSILDVRPSDLIGYTQCHFFAGVGVWSYALRRAGWDDSRPVWTGSCPCQPFSVAGQGAGFDDERHLWPYFHHLIRVSGPAVIFGEQVASKDADPWIDLVQDDLEALGYAVGAIPFPSAGVGAPHIRDRLYWVADAGERGWGRRANNDALHLNGAQAGWIKSTGDAERNSGAGGLADAHSSGLATSGRGELYREGQAGALTAHGNQAGRLADLHKDGRQPGREVRPVCQEHDAEHGGAARELADTYGRRRQTHAGTQPGVCERAVSTSSCGVPSDQPAGPTNGYWRDADWLLCRDGKWRPVEPGTFPLAHGAPARVGRLRAYGNAINAIQAQIFIEEVMGSLPSYI